MTLLQRFALVFGLLFTGWLLEVAKQLLVLNAHP